jgi:outer membrane protein insertion porin family
MNFLFLIFLFFFSNGWAVQDKIYLSKVNIECEKTDLVKQRKKKFGNLVGDYRNLVHLKDTIKILSADGGYKYFEYRVVKDSDSYELNIKFEMKPIIRKIKFSFKKDIINADAGDILSFKEGDFYQPFEVEQALGSLKKRIDSLGFPDNQTTYALNFNNDGVDIDINVESGKPIIFKKIRSNTKSLFITSFLTKKFYNLYNKPFDFTKFKFYLDEAEKELFNYGYYLINLEINPIIRDRRVVLDLKINNDSLFTFDFKNLKRQSRESLIVIVKNLFKQFKRPLTKSVLKQSLSDHYRKLSYLRPDIKITNSSFLNKFNEDVQLTTIFIAEGDKTLLKKVKFNGNLFFSSKKLKKFYRKQAFELASINFLDIEYLDYFRDFLRNQYIQAGFVQVKIDGPQLLSDAKNKDLNVEYSINEGPRTLIRHIRFKGVPPEFEDDIYKNLINKEGNYFNPISLQDDLKNITTFLQEHGYYFGEITNTNDDSLVKYSENSSIVDLFFQINSGQQIRLNKVIYLGNNKTRKKILAKKVFLKSGDFITPSKTRDLEATLSGTGLFNSVTVFPVRHSSARTETDLIIKTVERDYGLVEFAPGYRTDLGLKLSGTVSYLNIGGLNRSVALKSQINQRLNYQTFDPRRRKERKQLLEHNNTLTYNQSDIFDSSIDLGLGTSYQRKRFYSFDADIWRINSTLTREITRNLSSSLRYQWETIAQTDATEERDNGSFQIGAITPSLTFDFRNSPINPSRGAFMNMSCEFANPYFLSQDTNELKINYYKFVTRNRFYLPFKNGTVAISMVGGLQENLATDKIQDNDGNTVTEGYIPNIKVFRLTGMDIVRGFNDEEINRLPGGQDITETRVDKRAYLANFKLEPRFFVTDHFVAGMFYDAGRVFVDQVDLGTLRDSVGLTFKILTPVGTLDFDYGIKLLRKRNQDGSLEDPGRFHVSIGFF